MEEFHGTPATGSYNTNGHHYHQQQPGASNHRLRKPGRISRARDHRNGSVNGTRVFSEQQERENQRSPCTDFDVAYFQSYSHVGIHEEMIKDRVRTETYRNAILQHQNYIKDKVVVDVGCGTGILSIFCAQAGAKRVYAVDASDIATRANEVVKANNLSETIVVLHGRVEDVEINEEVDVIISEWMGYMLLYESMLGSVITARDRWLKPGGLILPSNATLYMAPVTHPERYGESIDFWRNVYGIDMSAMLPLAKQCAFEEPSVETISGENVLTWPHVVKHVDCYTVTVQELESITTKFNFRSMMQAPFHGFAFWFDVEFSGPVTLLADSDALSLQNYSSQPIEGSHRRKRPNPNEALVLSTAPEDPPTHWQQTLIYFYEPIEVDQDQDIEGSVRLSQSKENCRFMNIHLEYIRRPFLCKGVSIEMIRPKCSPGANLCYLLRMEIGKPPFTWHLYSHSFIPHLEGFLHHVLARPSLLLLLCQILSISLYSDISRLEIWSTVKNIVVQKVVTGYHLFFSGNSSHVWVLT